MFRRLLPLLLSVAAMLPAVAAAQDFDQVTAAMEELVAGHDLPGASLRVNKRGEVVYERHFGDYDAGTRIPIASASKWVAALTIARLVERGALRWDDRVGDYFPDAPADKQAITLEQLFSHTSGLPDGEPDCLSDPDYTLQTCAESILELPLIGTPGTVFAYGGNSMQVAGAMAELAAGMSWDDIFIDEMVIPLGLQATDWTTLSQAPGYVPNPNPRIGGGVRTTLADYGVLIDMVLARGRHGDVPFLSSATLDFMARDRTVGITDVYRPDNGIGYGYGLGQWLETVDGRPYVGGEPKFVATARRSSPGAFGFTPWVDPMRGIGGVLMVRGLNTELRPEILTLMTLVERSAPGTPACTPPTSRACR
jgi:CubicO group peptidase (beta-lactamase class C family)